MEYDQHPPTRDVVNGNFANGAIHFRFQTSGQKWWIPSRSYIRTRFQLTQGDGTTPVRLNDGVATNMPALSWAAKTGKRAARAGFDWADAEGVLAKISEELAELDDARVSQQQDKIEKQNLSLILIFR